MRIGSRKKWNKYLATYGSEKFRSKVQKRRGRMKKNNINSVGSAFALELLHKPTAAEIAFGNLLCELELCPFDFQRLILKPRLYILDFYFDRMLVAFEIDGGYHKGVQLSKDLERDQILAERFITTVRFSNEMVFSEPENVKAKVLQTLRGRIPVKQRNKVATEAIKFIGGIPGL